MSDAFYKAMQRRAERQLEQYVNGDIGITCEDALMMLVVSELRHIEFELSAVYDVLNSLQVDINAMKEGNRNE